MLWARSGGEPWPAIDVSEGEAYAMSNLGLAGVVGRKAPEPKLPPEEAPITGPDVMTPTKPADESAKAEPRAPVEEAEERDQG